MGGGVAALRWVIIEAPHVSYKQDQCVFSATQRKNVSSEAFIVSTNKDSKILHCALRELWA